MNTYGDYLLCEEYDGATPIFSPINSYIYVAKPPLLRASLESHVGVAFSATNSRGTARIATQGEESESQVVVPEYRQLDTIFAIRNINRSTGVSVDGNASVTDDYGVGIRGMTRQVGWLDLNLDARAWAKAAES